MKSMSSKEKNLKSEKMKERQDRIIMELQFDCFKQGIEKFSIASLDTFLQEEQFRIFIQLFKLVE